MLKSAGTVDLGERSWGHRSYPLGIEPTQSEPFIPREMGKIKVILAHINKDSYSPFKGFLSLAKNLYQHLKKS